MTSKPNKDQRFENVHKHLEWVPIAKLTINPVSQRPAKRHWVNRILKDFDLDKFTEPIVNYRSDADIYHIVDGQHRLESLKLFLGEGWETQYVFCWVYKDLDDQQEAEMFRGLQSQLPIAPIANWFVALTEQNADFCEMDAMVRAQGLRVGYPSQHEDTIQCVGAVERVWRRSGSVILGQALRICSKSFGKAGLQAGVIDGIALMCQRYKGHLDEKAAIARLNSLRGGVSALQQRAHELSLSTGNSKTHCIAAAAVEHINKGSRGAQRLPDWWKVA